MCNMQYACMWVFPDLNAENTKMLSKQIKTNTYYIIFETNNIFITVNPQLSNHFTATDGSYNKYSRTNVRKRITPNKRTILPVASTAGSFIENSLYCICWLASGWCMKTETSPREICKTKQFT